MFGLLVSIWAIALTGTTINTCNDLELDAKGCLEYIDENAVREYPTSKKEWTGYDPRAGK